MDGLLQMAVSLLSFAHSLFGPGICPGEWVWATMTAGFLLSLMPMFGVLIMALVRKGTGNRYNGVTTGVFGVLGASTTFVFPLLLFNGVSAVFREAHRGNQAYLSAEFSTLREGSCL